MNPFHYTACGLKNVFIEGLSEVVDHAGDETVTIPKINQLHKAISEGIVCHNHSMDGDELRFLRTEMGMTQAALAKVLHCTPLTVGRWERGEVEIGGTNEALVRKLAIETLELPVNKSIAQLSEASVPAAVVQGIEVSLSKEGYSLNNPCRAA